ncbi:unnamed protein product [Ixodes persulcatus]
MSELRRGQAGEGRCLERVSNRCAHHVLKCSPPNFARRAIGVEPLLPTIHRPAEQRRWMRQMPPQVALEHDARVRSPFLTKLLELSAGIGTSDSTKRQLARHHLFLLHTNGPHSMRGSTGC